jgi:hypothetical protein
MSDTGSSVGVGPTADDNQHIQVMSSDGAGHLNWWLDGTQIGTNVTDVSPKTMVNLLLGAGADGSNPTAQNGQLNGRIARFMIFNTALTSTQFNTVMNYLSTTYAISI